MKFVKNAWYVAGWSKEFRRELHKVKILEEDILMYRNSKDRVVALHDRCPHKLLPLSMGRLLDDDVQCGYHGTVFGPDGQCRRIPGQNRIPPTVCVRSYPVCERYNVVWIWMGDPNKAQTDEIFEIAQMSDPDWESHQGDALSIESNYLNVAENLVDPAHVTYVHPTTLGSASHADVPICYDSNPNVILAWRWIRDCPPIPFFQNFGNFTGNVDRWQYFYLHIPSIAVIDFGSADALPGSLDDRRLEGVRIISIHFLTPVTSSQTIDRWMHIRDTDIGDNAVAQKMDEMFRIAFDEDKEVLEAIQIEEGKQQLRSQVQFVIDQACISYRARIDQLVQQEALN